MKPYGNEHKDFGEGMNSSKTGARPGNKKTILRRLAKKVRRAQDKVTYGREL